MRSLPEERRKRAVGLALILTAAALLAGVYLLHIGRDMSDFGVCYQGGQRIVQGETLYRDADGHLQYKYSPTSALFFAPLALLPFGAAKVIWYILEFAFLAGIFLLFFKILPIAGKRAASTLAWTFLIELKFFAREIELGQVNLFILFLLTSMLYLLLWKKDIAAGFLWGSSLFFKPYALVFLPYFLIKRKFRTLVAGLATALIGLLLPAIFYGVRGNLAVLREWPATLSKSTSGLLASYDNASLYGFLLKTFSFLSKQATGAIFLTIFLALALAVLWMIKKGQEPAAPQNPEVLESAFLLILIPLFSPLGWNYNYLYSIPVVMIVIAGWRRLPPALRIILIVNFLAVSTSLIEVWGRELFRFYTHNALVALNFLIILVPLFYLRAKNIH
ncbi:MAG TPA: glycosyltransferase family 87 protein [Candidatus Desulfaltia sp.]|nr:glycosyltransferase family 87 protein [Candidatus Desulfaltia sp.]